MRKYPVLCCQDLSTIAPWTMPKADTQIRYVEPELFPLLALIHMPGFARKQSAHSAVSLTAVEVLAMLVGTQLSGSFGEQ